MFLKNLTEFNKLGILKCLFYYFKIFGVATMTFEITLAKNSTTYFWLFARSKKAVIYNIAYIVSLAATHIYSIPFFYLRTERVKFEKVMDCLQDTASCITSFFILTKFCVHTDKMIAIANSISKNTKSLLIMSSETQKQHQLITEIGTIFAINITIWVLTITVVMIDDVTFFLYDIIVYSGNFVINALLIQYTVILKFLEYNFKLLNDNLHEYTYEKSVMLRSSINSKMKVDKLLQLQQLHASLSEISRDVSSFYSYPMLMCILHIFCATTLACYYLTKPIILHKNNLTDTIYIHCFLYGFLFVVLLVTLTKCVGATITEVN